MAEVGRDILLCPTSVLELLGTHGTHHALIGFSEPRTECESSTWNLAFGTWDIRADEDITTCDSLITLSVTLGPRHQISARSASLCQTASQKVSTFQQAVSLDSDLRQRSGQTSASNSSDTRGTQPVTAAVQRAHEGGRKKASPARWICRCSLPAGPAVCVGSTGRFVKRYRAQLPGIERTSQASIFVETAAEAGSHCLPLLCITDGKCTARLAVNKSIGCRTFVTLNRRG